MSVGTLPPVPDKILRALARYRFLIVPQFLQLNAGNKHHLQTTLRTMCERKRQPLIGRLNFGVTPGIGTLHHVYYLTKHGAAALADVMHGSEIQFPERVTLAHNDYFHRLATIDCHIAVDQWAGKAGARVDRCERYIDRGKGEMQARTSLDVNTGRIVPDMILTFTHAGVSRTCCLEVYRKEPPAMVADKLGAYVPAHIDDSLVTALQTDDGVRILAVFDDIKVLRLVRQRLPKIADFDEVQDRYFLTTLDALQVDFRQCWQDTNGKQRALF